MADDKSTTVLAVLVFVQVGTTLIMNIQSASFDCLPSNHGAQLIDRPNTTIIFQNMNSPFSYKETSFLFWFLYHIYQ